MGEVIQRFSYLRNALRLKSASHIRMYEILKQYETLGKREIAVSDLQDMLGVHYSRWERFRTKVLDSSQQALRETTDICFDYERGKVGNGGKWFTIIFTIHKNIPEDKNMILFVDELEAHLHPQTAKAIQLEVEMHQDLQQMICFAGDLTPNEVKEIYYAMQMICFAGDLTPNEVKEIYYAMQEKGYADIFISFKRLYQTAVNNDPADLKKYILGIIKNDVVSKPENKTAEDPDIEKYKVLINKF